MGRRSGGVEPMFDQSAADMVALAGTPTAITTNDFPQWELDDGDGICGLTILPHGYGLGEPHVVFYDALANAGNLTLRLRVRALGFLQAVNVAYTLDQSIQTGTHPQNVPLPMVFTDVAIAGRTWTWRLDRVADTLADPIRIMGINWEVVG